MYSPTDRFDSLMIWLKNNLSDSVPKQVLLVDFVLVVWFAVSFQSYKHIPAAEPLPLLLAGVVGAGIILLFCLAVMLLYLFVPWGAPIYLFKLHRDFYLNYVPTKRNKARWVINALKKGKLP